MTKRRNPDSRIDEEMLREEMLREEEIRLKVESILDEEDEDVFEEMILGLDEEELDALDEAMGEMEEELDEECDEDEEDECLNEGCMDKGKHRLYEMAQPRHRNTVLSIPINNTDSTGPITIMFIAKTAKRYGITDNRIDMSDVPSPKMPNRISAQIYLAGDENSRTQQSVLDYESNEINDFATKVAMKYGKGVKQDIADIYTAIITCYNDFVVDHNSTMKSKMPTDTIVVDWDIATSRIVPR